MVKILRILLFTIAKKNILEDFMNGTKMVISLKYLKIESLQILLGLLMNLTANQLLKLKQNFIYHININ